MSECRLLNNDRSRSCKECKYGYYQFNSENNFCKKKESLLCIDFVYPDRFKACTKGIKWQTLEVDLYSKCKSYDYDGKCVCFASHMLNQDLNMCEKRSNLNNCAERQRGSDKCD
jgi:hypothetical protein